MTLDVSKQPTSDDVERVEESLPRAKHLPDTDADEEELEARVAGEVLDARKPEAEAHDNCSTAQAGTQEQRGTLQPSARVSRSATIGSAAKRLQERKMTKVAGPDTLSKSMPTKAKPRPGTTRSSRLSHTKQHSVESAAHPNRPIPTIKAAKPKLKDTLRTSSPNDKAPEDNILNDASNSKPNESSNSKRSEDIFEVPKSPSRDRSQHRTMKKMTTKVAHPGTKKPKAATLARAKIQPQTRAKPSNPAQSAMQMRTNERRGDRRQQASESDSEASDDELASADPDFRPSHIRATNSLIASATRSKRAALTQNSSSKRQKTDQASQDSPESGSDGQVRAKTAIMASRKSQGDLMTADSKASGDRIGAADVPMPQTRHRSRETAQAESNSAPGGTQERPVNISDDNEECEDENAGPEVYERDQCAVGAPDMESHGESEASAAFAEDNDFQDIGVLEQSLSHQAEELAPPKSPVALLDVKPRVVIPDVNVLLTNQSDNPDGMVHTAGSRRQEIHGRSSRPGQADGVADGDNDATNEEELLDDQQAKKPSVVGFDRRGPRNQGLMHAVSTPSRFSLGDSTKRRKQVTNPLGAVAVLKAQDGCHAIHNANSKANPIPIGQFEQWEALKPIVKPILLSQVAATAQPVFEKRRANYTVLADDREAGPPSSPLQRLSRLGNSRALLSAIAEAMITAAENDDLAVPDDHVSANAQPQDLALIPCAKRNCTNADLEDMTQLKRLKPSQTMYRDQPGLPKIAATAAVTRDSTVASTAVQPPLRTPVAVANAVLHKDFDDSGIHMNDSCMQSAGLRSNRKPIPADPSEPSRAITNSATSEQVDMVNAAYNPKVLDAGVFNSPLRPQTKTLPFMQHLKQLVTQQGTQDPLHAPGQLATLEDDNDSSSNDSYTDPDTPASVSQDQESDIVPHVEGWLHDLSPELIGVYRALQNVNKHIVLELRRTSAVARDVLDQYRTDAEALITLLGQERERLAVDKLAQEEAAVRKHAQQQAYALHQKHEAISSRSKGDDLSKWMEQRNDENSILQKLSNKAWYLDGHSSGSQHEQGGEGESYGDLHA